MRRVWFIPCLSTWMFLKSGFNFFFCSGKNERKGWPKRHNQHQLLYTDFSFNWEILILFGYFSLYTVTPKSRTLIRPFFPDIDELHFTKKIFVVLIVWKYYSPYLKLIWSFLTQGLNRWLLDKVTVK